MTPSNKSDNMYERLLSINHEAFEGGCYETAYHALAAALHRAQDIDAVQLLARVEEIAIEQMNFIDTHEPNHPLSSQSARTRGVQSIYRLLATQAATRGQIVASQQEQKNL